MLLADLGAEVVRLKRPEGGLRFGQPEHVLLNRGKRSVAAEPQHPSAPGLVLQLVDRANVLIEGIVPELPSSKGGLTLFVAEVLARKCRAR